LSFLFNYLSLSKLPIETGWWYGIDREHRQGLKCNSRNRQGLKCNSRNRQGLKCNSRNRQGLKCNSRNRQGLKCNSRNRQGLKCNSRNRQGLKCNSRSIGWQISIYYVMSTFYWKSNPINKLKSYSKTKYIKI
jgi:hypothetical protein